MIHTLPIIYPWIFPPYSSFYNLYIQVFFGIV